MSSKRYSTTDILSRKLSIEEDLEELKEEDDIEAIIDRDFFVGFYRNTYLVYEASKLGPLDLLEGNISLESINLVYIKWYLRRLLDVSRSEYRRLLKKAR